MAVESSSIARRLAQRASREEIEVTEIDEGQVGSRGNSRQSQAKIAIRVKTGYAEERVVELEPGSSVTRILEIVAADRDCTVEDLVVLREGERELLTSDLVVDAKYPCECRHHVHYPGEVTVTVYYQAGHQERRFKPFEAVKDVLAWAIEVFRIDATMATEFELTRRGQKEELPEPEHIGHLAGKDCKLALDLVRGVIANGSCS